jgi:hypothetical protein
MTGASFLELEGIVGDESSKMVGQGYSALPRPFLTGRAARISKISELIRGFLRLPSLRRWSARAPLAPLRLPGLVPPTLRQGGR